MSYTPTGIMDYGAQSSSSMVSEDHPMLDQAAGDEGIRKRSNPPTTVGILEGRRDRTRGRRLQTVNGIRTAPLVTIAPEDTYS